MTSSARLVFATFLVGPLCATFATFASLATVGGCSFAPSQGAAAGVRAVMDPPEFSNLQREDIHDAMRAMAVQVQALDEALRAADLDEATRQARVLGALELLKSGAQTLQTPGKTTHHAMIEQRLPQFLQDLDNARTQAAQTPPQYFLAGSISGSCMACHRGR